MNKIEKNVRKFVHFLDNDPQTTPLPQKKPFWLCDPYDALCFETNEKLIFRFLVFEIWSIWLSRYTLQIVSSDLKIKLCIRFRQFWIFFFNKKQNLKHFFIMGPAPLKIRFLVPEDAQCSETYAKIIFRFFSFNDDVT